MSGLRFTTPHLRSKRPRLPQSTGEAAELAAQFWFRSHGWQMDRSQPATRRVWRDGKAVIVPDGKRGTGIFDYTGNVHGFYRAVEVKEASGESMPASRLSKAQREWGASRPPGTAFVLILWVDRRVLTLHPFKREGAYRFEEGIQ